MWKLGRVTGNGISKDGKSAVYSVKTYNVTENNSSTETFVVPVIGGAAMQTFNKDSVTKDKNISEENIQHLALNTQHNEANMEVHKHPHQVTHKKKWGE